MKTNFSLLALAALASQRLFSGSSAIAANERLIITPDMELDPGMDRGKPGEIYAANEEDLKAAWKNGDVFEAANDGNLAAGVLALHQPLTQFTTGVQDRENLLEILNRVAPLCPAGGLYFDYLNETESEEFQKRTLQSIERPVHGEFPMRKVTGQMVSGKCKNYGLVTYLDRDQGGLLPAMQQAQVASTRNIILRSLLADAFQQIDDNASADSSSNWNDSTANPDGDARAMVKASGDARGEEPNVVVFGNGSWHYRLDSYEKPSRTNAGNHADWLPERLAQYLGVDDVILSKTRYRSSASATSGIVGAKVYTYSARPGLMPSDSSNLKRFQYVGDGGEFRVFIEVGSHRVKIIVDCQAVNKITSTVGIRKRTITWS